MNLKSDAIYIIFDPSGPGRTGGHYFHTRCPYVTKKQKHAKALKQNTQQR